MTLVLSIIVMLSVTADSSGAQAPGEWSEPVQILSTMVRGMESCEDAVLAYGYNASACCEDAGDNWDSEKAFNGMVEFAGGTMYRANMTDWQEYYGGTISFSKSDDLGDTWSDAVEVITLDGRNDYAFGIYLLDTTLFIYTYDFAGSQHGNITLSKSTDYGATWSVPIVVDQQVLAIDPWLSDMVLWNGKAYIAYYNSSLDSTDLHVVLIESSDMGETWENRQVIAEGGLPSLKADDDALYVSYLNVNDDASVGAHFIKSTDGATWSTPIEVGPMVGFSDQAVLHSMAVHGDEIFVAYTDINTSGPEYTYTVRLNHSADGGATWEDMGNVTGGNGDEMGPVLVTTEDRLHLAWTDAMGSGGWSDDKTSFYRYLTIEPVTHADGPDVFLAPVLAVVAAVGIIVLVYAMRRMKSRPKPPA